MGTRRLFASIVEWAIVLVCNDGETEKRWVKRRDWKTGDDWKGGDFVK